LDAAVVSSWKGNPYLNSSLRTTRFVPLDVQPSANYQRVNTTNCANQSIGYFVFAHLEHYESAGIAAARRIPCDVSCEVALSARGKSGKYAELPRTHSARHSVKAVEAGWNPELSAPFEVVLQACPPT
jgi:hypothetical protein